MNSNFLHLTHQVEYYQYVEKSRTETIEYADGSEEVLTTYTNYKK